MGITPHIVIGDLDSVKASTIKCKTISFPPEKDKSDLEIAIEYAINLRYEDIHILGALGKRIDHTLFNIQLLFNKKFKGKLKIIGDGEILFSAPHKTILNEKKGTCISLIPFSNKVKGVTLQGFLYPLKGEDIYMGSSRTLSNVIKNPPAIITYKEGNLLIVIEKKGI